jgi:hypothetical protein
MDEWLVVLIVVLVGGGIGAVALVWRIGAALEGDAAQGAPGPEGRWDA